LFSFINPALGFCFVFIHYKKVKMKKLIYVFGLLFAFCLKSQVIPNKDWVQQVTNGGIEIHGIAAAVDYTTGAVYSCGYMNTVSNGKDVVVVKLDSNGVQLWSTSYNYATVNLDDKANAIFVDPSGNVYVTGYSQAASNNADIIVIKYNSSGTQQWATRINGSASGDDAGNDIAVDGSGNVMVAGYLTLTGKGKDFTVAKLNSSGTALGSLKINGSANSDEMAEKLVIDGSNCFATGCVKNTSTNKEVLTVCIAMSGPSLTWSTTVNGTANSDDMGYDITTYSTSVYICGKTNNTTTGEDYYFAKMNQSNGSITSSNTYDGGYNGSDFATSIVSDKIGDFGITGIVTNGSNTEYHTQMYDGSGLVWTHVQPQNGSYTTTYPKIACDTLAYHYYVCGAYFAGNQDGILYQVDPTGTKRWTQYHVGAGGARDAFIDLALDGLGRIFVASADETATSSNTYDYNIIRYSQTPVYMPVNYNMASDTFSYSHLFYPNTLEVLDTNGSFVNNVLFYTQFAYPKEFVEKNRVMFAERSSTITNRVDMIFDGANEFGEVYGADYQNDAVLNYFLDYTGTNGHVNVKGASHLICPNIYPMIDLHYSSNGNGAKYYFVVKPTGDPNNIRIRFDGATSTSTVSNDLVINSPISTWKFKKPDVYNVSVPSWTNLTITTTSVTGNARWVSMGSDTYSIDPGTYNSAWPLVIEFDKGKFSAPTSTNNINWSTFYGLSGADWIFDTKCDASNYLLICGSSDSQNLPGSSGSFQSGNASYTQARSDGFVARFNPSGKLRWATFVGGNDIETLSSLDHAPTGTDIYCVGYTGSNNLVTIPKSGAINTSTFNTGSGTDVMIFQVDSSGKTCNWLTYWGGNSADYAMKCKFDKNKNFVIVGASLSSNISPYGTSPTYTANYSDPYSGYDAFILKLDSATHNNKWFTFIGSSTSTYSFSPCTDDWLLDLDFNSANELFVVGSSTGNNYPTVGTGTFGLASLCYSDGIISKISNSGQIIWSSYYGGTDAEMIHSVKTYTNDDVYFAGQTAGANTFPTQSSSKFYYDTYKATSGANVGGFFVNYDNSMTRQHATLIGGDGNDLIYDMEIDAAGGIYLLGKSTSSAITTPSLGNPANTYNSVSTTGSYDYLIYSLRPNYTDVVWATMVGGNGQEGAGIRRAVNGTIDGNNRLFIAGTSQSNTLMPVDNGGGGGVWFQPTINGAYDGTITRFNLSPTNGIGITEYNKESQEIYVFPNPANNLLSVKMNKLKGKQSYKIYNNLGQVVLFGNLENSKSINISSLSEGMYILELINAESRGTTKFIKYD
jgi:hypothetical protein